MLPWLRGAGISTQYNELILLDNEYCLKTRIFLNNGENNFFFLNANEVHIFSHSLWFFPQIQYKMQKKQQRRNEFSQQSKHTKYTHVISTATGDKLKTEFTNLIYTSVWFIEFMLDYMEEINN